jgi:hypothetical protein
MRWLGRGAVAIGRGIVVVIAWIDQGLRAAGRLVGPVLRRFAAGCGRFSHRSSAGSGGRCQRSAARSPEVWSGRLGSWGRRWLPPALVQVTGRLLAAAAGAIDQFLRDLWRGVTTPFRWLRRALRPFAVAVGDLKRRSAVLMRRQWRALRGSS